MRFHNLPPAEQIVKIMEWIYDAGMTTTTGGNISIRDTNGDIWITPSSIDKGSLSPMDIVRIGPNSTSEVEHRASSELPTHRAIYDARPDINAIIHAHPSALISFSIVRKKPDTSVIPQAKNICGNVGYAPYRTPGTKALGKRIAMEFEKGCNSIIMENHGAVVGGADPDDAFQRFETLEFCAHTIIKASQIGTYNSLSKVQIQQFNELQPSLPESDNTEYPTDEEAIREAICRFVQRSCRQKLMISTYGTVSVRWRENDIIITPTGINRKLLGPGDLVQIKDGKREPGKHPSRAVKLHHQIYKKHQHIGCIITTQSPNATAYCVARQTFDNRTIPESYVFLRDIPLMPYGSQLRDSEFIPGKLSKKTPILLIENDAILITGRTLLEAYDRLEVTEFSARSIINSTSLGDLVPINERELKKLDKIAREM